jgi:hypothetical protein
VSEEGWELFDVMVAVSEIKIPQKMNATRQ